MDKGQEKERQRGSNKETEKGRQGKRKRGMESTRARIERERDGEKLKSLGDRLL